MTFNINFVIKLCQKKVLTAQGRENFMSTPTLQRTTSSRSVTQFASQMEGSSRPGSPHSGKQLTCLYTSLDEKACEILKGIFVAFDKRTEENDKDFCFRAVLNTCRLRNWQLIQVAMDKASEVLEKLCNINDEPPLFSLIGENGEFDNETLGLLLQQDPKLVHALSGNQQNQALHFAIRKGNSVAISILCRNRGDRYLDALDDAKLTPLRAAMRYRPDMIPALIKAGAVFTSHSCAMEKYEYDVKSQGDRLDCHPSKTKKEYRLSSLCLSIQEGNIESLKQFVKEGNIAEWCYIVKDVGNLLHVAILSDQQQMLEHLLDEYHARTRTAMLNSMNNDGDSPLIFAVKQQKQFALTVLLKRGADPNVRDKEGRTALHWCALIGLDRYITVLRDYGADVDLSDFSKAKAKPEELARLMLTKNVEVDYKLSFQARPPPQIEPNFRLYRPSCLVIRGGGAKDLGYIGATKILEEANIFADLEHIAGTSAGAISATLIAMGCTSNLMQDYLTDIPLNEILLGKPFWQTPQKTIRKLTSVLQPSRITPKNILKTLWSMTGSFDGESFRLWIEEKIHTATGIEHCTFGELEDLILRKQTTKIGHKSVLFKHLHIYGIRIENKPEVVDFRSEFCEDEDVWIKDVIISDAVRISMSIPFVFQPHYVHVKLRGLERSCLREHGAYVDGGLIKNFPMDTFDCARYMTYSKLSGIQGSAPMRNPRTLGLTLEPPPEGKREQSDLFYDEIAKEFQKACSACPPLVNLASIIQIYGNNETLARSKDSNDYDLRRVIKISTEGVGMLDFNMSSDKLESLITAGKRAVINSRFFGELAHSATHKSNVPEAVRHFQGAASQLGAIMSALDPKHWHPKIPIAPQGNFMKKTLHRSP